jgi:hypothetical protein
MMSNKISVVFLALGLLANRCSADNGTFTAGPLSPARLNAAAEAAGFKVIENKSNIPAAAYSRIPFVASDYDDKHLAALREKYQLEKVIAQARDEWTAQQLLKVWVHGKIDTVDWITGRGEVTSNAWHALDILEESARGERFYCTHYAITYAECALALGWQARKVGIDRPHGKNGGSSHHGVAEVWSNMLAKWVVIDSHFNIHYEKKGVPLSAWEVRAEWLRNKGADVDHVDGAPPLTAKLPKRRGWQHPENDTSAYFWNYILTRLETTDGHEPAKKIFLQDAANDSLLWYQNANGRKDRSRLHVGYLNNTFVPTRRLEDAYWTVGVVDATVSQVTSKSIVFRLKSYCPNQVAFERSVDSHKWERIPDEKSVEWPLKSGWNSLVLRTLSRGNVTGPVTTLLLYLE